MVCFDILVQVLILKGLRVQMRFNYSNVAFSDSKELIPKPLRISGTDRLSPQKFPIGILQND